MSLWLFCIHLHHRVATRDGLFSLRSFCLLLWLVLCFFCDHFASLCGWFVFVSCHFEFLCGNFMYLWLIVVNCVFLCGQFYILSLISFSAVILCLFFVNLWLLVFMSLCGCLIRIPTRKSPPVEVCSSCSSSSTPFPIFWFCGGGEKSWRKEKPQQSFEISWIQYIHIV